MHILQVKKKKYEVFPIDFRRNIVYSFKFKGDVASHVQEYVESNGYKEGKNGFYECGSFAINLDCDNLSFVFASRGVKRNERIKVVVNAMSSICDKNDVEMEMISVSYLNRYVLNPFDPNESNKTSALRFFFKNIEENGDFEPFSNNREKDLFAILKIRWDDPIQDKVNLNSTIISAKGVKELELKDLSSVLCEIEDFGYCFWRNIVSENVIKAMKNEKR